MTKIYSKPPLQTHKTTTTTNNNTNTLLIRRAKFERILQSSPPNEVVHKKYYPNNSPQLSDGDNDDNHPISPFNLQTLTLSPWITSLIPNHHTNKTKFDNSPCYLIGSLVRQDGHVHSLAVRSGTLYTGSESNNIRIWRNFDDVGSLKAGSGFVKAISLSNSKTNSYRIFTGHNDGKIRVWTHDGKRVGTFPKLTDYIKNSIKHRHLKKHCDAISCLSLNEELGLLYSGSWDKTINVWNVKDGKWLESINAHVDAINSIAVGFCGAVFSGGADGALKMWRRRGSTCAARHVHVRTLMEQENAVTSLSVASDDVLYCGSSDGLVRFWERESEKKLLEVVYGGVLRGHKLAVLCLATAGCMVFSGSADKSICVWRRERGLGGVHSCLAVLKGHSGPVKCLAVEPDRDHDEEENVDYDDDQRRRWIVYSGSLDKSIRIWRVSEYMH